MVGTYLFLVSLMYTLTSLVEADVSIVANWTVNNNYYNAQSFYYEGEYYMLFENEPNTVNNMYSLGFYSLNGTNPLYKAIDVSTIATNITSAQRFCVEPPGAGLEGLGAKSSVRICSAVGCKSFIVVGSPLENRPLSILSGQDSYWCNSYAGIRSTDSILAFDNTHGTRNSIVVQRSNSMLGFSCLTDTSGTQTIPGYELTCSHSSGPLTEIRTAETRVHDNKIWIFSIQANSQVTVLCTHIVSSNQTASPHSIPEKSSLVLNDSPTSLAISDVGKDFLAYVSTAAGIISKVSTHNIFSSNVTSTPLFFLNEIVT